MEFWQNLWTIVFIASLAVFAVLAVVVTIGGFFNILSLLKNLAAQHKEVAEQQQTLEEPQQ